MPQPPSFAQLGIVPDLATGVAKLGFVEPTAVQAECIPALLAGRDVIGQSKTGSGKTAAFGLPLLQRLHGQSDSGGTRVHGLVLCPTRELCGQVARELRRFGRGLPGLRILELVGGQPARPQRDSLARGFHVAVGTPGRVMDHLRTGALGALSIQFLVLDEADRMLDMGFGPDVKRIARSLPSERQTTLFSATFPESIDGMSQEVLRSDAIRLFGETLDEVAGEGVAGTRQLYCVPDGSSPFLTLSQVLAEFPFDSAIVFCNFKASVADLTGSLREAGVSADRLDGDLDQFHRDQVLARFRNGSIRVLVATDVAGRGIDIDGLDLVVNYELPSQPEIYIHRIGRTGRAGREGLAVSLAASTEDPKVAAIEDQTGVLLERVSFPPGGHDAWNVLASVAGPPSMATILISGGRKDKVRRGDILGALTGEAGALRGDQVGVIEVRDRLSYVAVSEPVARAAAARLNKGRIKGKRYRATVVFGPR